MWRVFIIACRAFVLVFASDYNFRFMYAYLSEVVIVEFVGIAIFLGGLAARTARNVFQGIWSHEYYKMKSLLLWEE